MSKNPGKRSQQQNDFLEPLAPINVVATNVGTNRAFNNGAASVAFSLPALSPEATSFTVTATAAGQTTRTATGSSSPVVVGTLTSAITYTISVTATNAAGTSPASETTTVPITTVPATPSAPTVTNSTANTTDPASNANQIDAVSWLAPATGGSPITSYFWESNDAKSATTTSTSANVLQEANTSQQYRVRAANANGNSVFSPYSVQNTTPPFFPPFFPFFPPFFPFFPPFFPFFPFFPPRFPFFPFFPPRFPFFPFFPPRFAIRPI
jgi:hypothetical protein